MSWARWRDKFAMLIDPRFYTLEWLDDEIAARRVILICNDRAAVLVTLKPYPTGALEIHGLAAAGELSDIVQELIPAAEDFGRLNGCIVATIESREGWVKVLEPYGYRPFQTSIRKDL